MHIILVTTTLTMTYLSIHTCTYIIHTYTHTYIGLLLDNDSGLSAYNKLASGSGSVPGSDSR